MSSNAHRVLSKSPTACAPPPHWPPHVRYISEPHYHSSVPLQVRAHICPQSPSATHPSRSLTIIRRIVEPSHPAYGQFGLFAAKKIQPRVHIVDYVGEVHCDDRPQSDYDLSLLRTQDGLSVGVDAHSMGNEARFINDYRSINAKPNAVFEDRRTATGELRMSIWSGSESIKKGEEILVSYGKAWWHARTSPQTCELAAG
ncbi:uncharacterized protein FIBRA_03692 [Fibroporia radiculosa]|uniref:SET domain-containing protein n=1 Tax=Fibroporia radiculosa TaxID=599839 RepID=J4I9R7_9APHY|nr:uncharacterized protein FIBRA_03692 [Fibroporia radiculosa]CCM01631.1 predicted protein [Fibroporia radiculosa]